MAKTQKDLIEAGYQAAQDGKPCNAPTTKERNRAAWEQGWRAGKPIMVGQIEHANPTQRDWLLRMKATVDHLHNQWYGHDGFETVHSGLDQGLLQDTDRKIRLACKRLGIAVMEAHDPDGWDGEEFGPIVTLWDALREIRRHFGLLDHYKSYVLPRLSRKNKRFG